MKRQPSLFEGTRLTMEESIDLTVESINAYGDRHARWGIAWSGGKDSTALVTLIVHLIETGRIERPSSLHVLYADTRMELTPLVVSAQSIIHALRQRKWLDVRVVMADLDKRFFVYMLGRGVPPPNNNTFRWCTRQIKVDPMKHALQEMRKDGEKFLMLTGVRQGESAIRDQRIAMSCGRDGAECGQGWYQETLPEALCDTLAPLLHWRVCHVWDWLRFFAPEQGFDTAMLADAYGGDEAEEINARTGCVGCPLAQRDTALDAVIAQPEWAYLTPLKGLRQIYRLLREPRNRLRQRGGERRKDGTLSPNQHRMGPLTIDARRWALNEILSIQQRVNEAARREGRAEIDILNAEEVRRIRELIAANTWPQRWTGEEPRADEPFDEILPDGTVQLSILSGGAMEGSD